MELARRYGPAAIITIWLLWFAGDGLRAPFTGDDLICLHTYLGKPAYKLVLDNFAYASPAFRPLGALLYVPLYHWFGFDPLPFRIVCFLLLGLNIYLLYTLCLSLLNSRPAAYIAAFLGSYHAWFVDLYYSSATVFELLCFTFYALALIRYIRWRQSGDLSWTKLALLSLLYIAALNSKEMAVTLPVAMFAYEMLYHRRDFKAPILTALLTIPYVIGKTSPGSLADNPAYRLTISPGRYLDAFHLYLNPLLYLDHFFRDATAVRLLLLMLGIALWRRSRPMLFAWCFVLFSILPVAFIAHHSGFFLYLPSIGWCLFTAGLLEPLTARVPAIILVALLAAALAPLHQRESEQTRRVFRTTSLPTRQFAMQFLSQQPSLPPGSTVVLLGGSDWTDPFLTMLTRLVYRDLTISVHRRMIAPADTVFSFECGSWRRIQACKPDVTAGNRVIQ